VPLRQIQIVVPSERQEELQGLLDDACATSEYSTPVDDGYTLTCVTVRMELVEPITDAVLDRFDGDGEFRLSILSVEATHPTLPEPEQEEDPAPQEEKSWSPRFGRVSREELIEDIQGAAKTTPVSMIMVVLSTIVACVGLMKGSAAIVIGAMMIAPLLGPNIALALGTSLGDLDMIKRAIRSNFVGVFLALLIAVVFGLFLSSDVSTAEIDSRTVVDLGDLLLALAAGAAGAIAFTSGAPQVVVGVMVAVALLPPTAVCGIMVGNARWLDASEAALLTATNVACINLSATSVFLIQGVKPSMWWEKERAKGASLRAMIAWTVALAILATLIILTDLYPS
jgi:uncharacterized hydrophobic protein (TIGR00341 family)